MVLYKTLKFEFYKSFNLFKSNDNSNRTLESKIREIRKQMHL